MSSTDAPYTRDFYAEQGGGSLDSARAVVPILMALFQPTSVVDVGCGVGGWAAEFATHGVPDVLGIDGDWVDPEKLAISAEQFTAMDLARPIALGRTFDMCLCLEVAEHLEEVHAPVLVKSLTSLAPVVAFSAAIPGQTGTGHVNEQWQSYWAALFEDQAYTLIDCVRPRVWRRADVQWWYAQNLLVYVRNDLFSQRADLVQLQSRTDPGPIDVIHPRLWASTLASRTDSGRRLARVRRWARRLRGSP